MGGSFRFGRVLGIPLYAHYSWLAIFVLVSFNLAMLFATVDPVAGWPTAPRVLLAVMTSLLFFGSVLLHELGHSVVALYHGIRVTSITLFIFGGAAQIAREADRPRTELLVAIAGPLTSFALGGLCWGVAVLAGAGAGWLTVPAAYLALINLALGAFNLVPGFPMDGGRVLRAGLWASTGSFERATLIASGVGRGVGLLFMAGGALLVILTGDLSGLWLALIGWFLENAAASSVTQVQLSRALEGVVAEAIMATDTPAVAPHLHLDLLVEGHILPTGQRCFLVASGERTVGIITLGTVAQVPRDQWAALTVEQTMVPLADAVRATPATPALTVLTAMVERNVNQVPVVDEDERVVGLVTRERLLDLVRTRAGLKV